MIIMRGMVSQVSHFFDVAAAWRRCWMVVTLLDLYWHQWKIKNVNSVASFNATEKTNYTY